MNFQQSPIKRRVSRQIMVGDVPVGGDAPISVQTMTNTPTSDVKKTVEQIESVERAGADIVRVSVPSLAEAEAFGEIKRRTKIPLVADIHFDHKIALRVADLGVDCLRINPGNISREERLREVIAKARDLNIPLRIGVNAGSLGRDLLRKYGEPNAEALVESAMRNVDRLDKYDFQNFKVSVKASEGFRSGTVKSSIGLGALLLDGIGDTMRISLAADPAEEVKVAWDMLRSLRLRTRGINFIACPSCSRQNFDVISTVNELERRLEDITTPLDVSIIGCIVNGPGEAKISDFGLTGGAPSNLIYLDGVPDHKISQEDLVATLEREIRQKALSKEKQLASVEAQIIAKG